MMKLRFWNAALGSYTNGVAFDDTATAVEYAAEYFGKTRGFITHAILVRTSDGATIERIIRQ
jgi:hypothetical protein